MSRLHALFACTLLVGLGVLSTVAVARDSLPSWNDIPPERVIGSSIKTQFAMRFEIRFFGTSSA